jgi:transcriptional regulator with XRE-family HTH domain
MSLNKRLEEIIQHYKLNQKDFAAMAGVAQNTFSRAISAGTSPRFEFFNRILNHYKDINARWLITGEGSMFSGEERIIKLTAPESDEIQAKGSDVYKELYEMERRRSSELEREIGKLTGECDRLKMALNQGSNQSNQKAG